MTINLGLFGDLQIVDGEFGFPNLVVTQEELGVKTLGTAFLDDDLELRDADEMRSASDTETAEKGGRFFSSNGMKATSDSVQPADLAELMTSLGKKNKSKRQEYFAGFNKSSKMLVDDLTA